MTKYLTARKVCYGVVTALLAALLIFLVGAWNGNLITRAELQASYLTGEAINSEYVTIAQHNLYLGEMSSLRKTVDEMHSDIKILLMQNKCSNEVSQTPEDIPKPKGPKGPKKRKVIVNTNVSEF